MKKIIMRWFGLLFLLVCACAALASPRQPIPPAPERPAIYQETFNEFAAPLSTNDFLSVAGFALTADWSGYGLSCTGPTVTPWAVPALSAGRTNVESDAPGAFRVWFNPDYSSSSIVGGTGPGEIAKLADFVATSSGGTAEIWTLEVSSNGNVLEAVGYGSSGPVTLLSAPIAWQAGSPHLIAFNYSSSATALFVDGQLVAQGAGTVAIPPSVGGLVLGSSFDGTEPAQGVLDEVFCFASPLTSQEISFYYNYTIPEAVLGPISTEEDARRAWLRSHRLSGGLSTMSPMSLGRVYDPDHDLTCSPGGQVYFTNVTATLQTNGTTTINFDVQGGTNGIFYDCYELSDLGQVLNNTAWQWQGQFLTCNTVTLTNEPGSQAFYMLVAPTVTTMYAWGTNNAGQCNVPVGLTSATAVAAGGEFSMALLTNGTVTVWGTNTYGETNLPAGLTNVVSIAAGEYHGVALLPNGAVTNWGSFYDGANYYSVTNTSVATMPPTSNVMAIAAGWEHDLALLSNGTVVAFGLLTADARTVPTNLTGVKAIACGWVHDVALLSNGVVRAWGDNYTGFETNMTTVPADLTNVAAIAAAGFDSLALRANGTLEAWGDTHYGLTLVPSGLSNVVAIAVGGNQMLALQASGNVVGWGATNFTSATVPTNLIAVKAIASGFAHNLVIYSDSLAPLSAQPPNGYALAGGSFTFTAAGLPFANVQYQWQFDGTNITGATNSTLTITNAQATNDGSYRLVISHGTGSVTGAAAVFTLVTAPQIVSNAPPVPGVTWITTNTTLSVGVNAVGQSVYPLSYQWQFNGTNLSGATTSSYTIENPVATNEGTYTLVVTNAAGGTNATWTVRLAGPGMVDSWGADASGECDRPASLTNASGIAAGEYQSLAVTDSGTVLQWGEYSDGLNFYSVTNAAAVTAPPGSNVVAVAAGLGQALALKSDSTVVAWGLTNAFGTTVPTNLNLTNVIAIGCGWQFDVALLSNGTVKAWGDDDPALGYTMTNVPPNLSNVIAIAAGPLHTLALKSDGTVVAWGYSPDGETNVPAGLSNVVAIAAGESHNLALKSDGTVVAWGLNNFGQTNVPAGLSNVMAIAAGDAHSVAEKNDGTLVEWGDNSSGESTVPTQAPTTITEGDTDPSTFTVPPIVVKLIAAGGDHTMAAISSPLVQYPINVSKDLLLIYNTNSAGNGSSNVCAYYLANRPMVASANVLAIGCTTNEIIEAGDYTTNLAGPVKSWLASNPTKRPAYVILFQDIPSRVDTGAPSTPSVQYELNTVCATNWHPFITSINMNGTGGTNDCIAYIDKIVSASSNQPGLLIISGIKAGYPDTNWYFDGAAYTSFASQSALGVSNAITSPSITYTTNAYITLGTNVAGYWSPGFDGGIGSYSNYNSYATNGDVKFRGTNGWFVMATVDSYNGQRNSYQGGFLTWYAASAFGGTNYSNTPIGTVDHVDEPTTIGQEDDYTYYRDWAMGKPFGMTVWDALFHNSVGNFIHCAANGDPFVSR